ncbi:MAG: hypothetical protein AB4911_12740 [Oscillochloridaceae bacterium umkhey_bin13]
MAVNSSADYQAPVAELLTVGDARVITIETHVAALDLKQEHVPELVRMVLDPTLNNAPSDSLEVWAPIHALHALKLFDASAHVSELMPLLERWDDDWFSEDLPKLFGQIGQPAVAPLQAYLADPAHNEWALALVTSALAAIGQNHPAMRDEVVTILSAVLRDAEQYEEIPCTYAMDGLVELDAVESLPLIRHAFELDKIDTIVRGSWGDILDQFGVDPDPADPLIALSQQYDEERRKQFFPKGFRHDLLAALGSEPESAFARLADQHGVNAGLPDSPAALQQADDKARKERQRNAEAQARKAKQKRKAASASRKANKKKK